MAVQTVKQVDRFKTSLAIVDVIGIVVFFWTLNWLILVYLALFNFMIIFIDVVRRGMVVHQPEHPHMPDEIPVDPDTGNLLQNIEIEEKKEMNIKKEERKEQSIVKNTAQPMQMPPVQRAAAVIPQMQRIEKMRTEQTLFEGIEEQEQGNKEHEKKEYAKSNQKKEILKKDPEREDIEQTLEEWGS